ncbi:hypothetical protein [Lacrimispora sp.]|uniref:hypothetical protein n=1 Tax=Lacrimispora sp. TaxID=2719234 RepID=UPI0029E5F7F6|nr:hypothetical protein [Lacrimispora sp.]
MKKNIQNLNNGFLDKNVVYDYVVNTFRAYADAMIPQSPNLAKQYGKIQFYGALESYTAEYLIMSLDSYPTPFAIAAAEILNLAAKQYLMDKGEDWDLPDDSGGVYFLKLTPEDRLKTIDRITSTDGIIYIPAGLLMKPGDIAPVLPALNRLTMMGYYSEWSGYGSTRFMSPNLRVLEYIPISWKQIGYPGPSLGYRIPGGYKFVQKQ